MEINNYLDLLSENNAKAGGGSASAFAGAMATSLILKAFYMIKKRYPELDDKLQEHYEQDLLRLKEYYKEMIITDGKLFEKVLEAYSLSKETHGDRVYRKQRVEEAYKDAFESPYNMMIHAVKLYDYIFTIKDFSDRMSDSELLIAQTLIDACYNSSRVNMSLNKKYITDKDFLEKKKHNILKIEQSYVYKRKKFFVLFLSKE